MADLPQRAVGDVVLEWTRLRLGLGRKRRDLDGAAPAGITGIGLLIEADRLADTQLLEAVVGDRGAMEKEIARL
jgi:hypothetical protein